ncbi:MAG: iron ABC transporter permease, partial [Oscillospiraceae bacterium]|nr:iron ABC transporter permease [Oscillospiraceae bacterium]
SAGIDAILTFFPDSLIGYSDFRIGGMSNLTMAKVLPAGIIILLCIGASLLMSNEMDVLTLGSDTAQSLGLPVKRVRILLLGLAAALAGAAVSFSGLLGFVGLIVPHIMRRLMGGGSKPLLAGCALGGAALLTLCDIAARTLFAPYELPVGIVLSLCGGPFFLWLLFRKKGVTHP